MRLLRHQASLHSALGVLKRSAPCISSSISLYNGRLSFSRFITRSAMRIPRLYIDQSLTVGQQLQLPADAAHYVSKVLRLKTGRQVLLFNGQGGEYQAVLSSVDRRSVAIDVEAFVDVDRESPLRVELAIGISRGERMNWVIQKATELGVSVITPLFTERTEVKLDESRQASRLQHWLQVAISACEQSQRTRLPLISAPQPLSSFLDNCSAQRKLVLHPTAEEAGLDVNA